MEHKTEHTNPQASSQTGFDQNAKAGAQALSDKPETATNEHNERDTINVDAAVPSDDTAAAGWEKKYQDLNDQYVRLAADFENFRKRQLQEHEAARKYGIENTFRELLPTLDNLERATGSLNETSDPKMLYQSFRLMYNQLLETFANLGLKKMETVGKPFDPNFHEAVAQAENPDFPDHAIVQEYQSGFLLQDRVVRPAMVVVNSRPGSAPAAETPENPFKTQMNNAAFNPEKESK